MTVSNPDSINGQKLPLLPVQPLRERVLRRVHALETQLTREEACEKVGVTTRMLNHWERGTYDAVRFDVADRVLIALGLNWFDVWTEDEYPEIHARLGW